VTVSGLEPGWRYQFRVVAENSAGRSDPSPLSEPLTVTLARGTPIAAVAPHFSKELHNCAALENDKVSKHAVMPSNARWSPKRPSDDSVATRPCYLAAPQKDHAISQPVLKHGFWRAVFVKRVFRKALEARTLVKGWLSAMCGLFKHLRVTV